MLVAVSRRARQFFGALHVVEHQDGLAEALALLNPEQRTLFQAQTPRDRKHALDCFRQLPGASDDLKRAALLHDVAKGDLRVHERVLFVLLQLGPLPLLRRLAAADGAHWRRSLYASLHHAERGADAARAAGASEKVVRLIRDHHLPAREVEGPLARLIRADDRA